MDENNKAEFFYDKIVTLPQKSTAITLQLLYSKIMKLYFANNT